MADELERRLPSRVVRAAIALALGLALSCGDVGNPQGTRALPDEQAEVAVAAVAPVAPVDAAEAERLMALGYVEVVPGGAGDEVAGARLLDSHRMQDGLTFYVNAHLCTAELIDAEGEVIRSWGHEPCLKWGNAVLLPDGGILVIHREPGDGARARSLIRLDPESALLWRTDLSAHHDVDVMPDGRVAVLTHRLRPIPEIDPNVPVRDHYLTLLDADGAFLEEASLTEFLQRSARYRFRSIPPREQQGALEIDLIHSNSVEWMRDAELAREHPLFGLDNVLICSRNQNSVFILNWKTRDVVWSWGQGRISGPHDATMLPSGNVLIFDNGLGRGSSRVVEVDPRTDEIVWAFEGEGEQRFFSSHRGASQRLANGNTLITVSAEGRAFEVTRDGDEVWSFVNPNRSKEGDRVVIVRTRRVQLDVESPRFIRSD